MKDQVCIICDLPLAQPISFETGICASHRAEHIPSHIPEAQQRRYLKRIGIYEKYTKRT